MATVKEVGRQMERSLLAGCLALAVAFGASACTKSEEPTAPAEAPKAEAPAAAPAPKAAPADPMGSEQKPAEPAPAEQPDET